MTPTPAPPINIAHCLHSKKGDESYAKALAACYISIKERTNRSLSYYIIKDSTTPDRIICNLTDLISKNDSINIIDIEPYSDIYSISLKDEIYKPYAPSIIWRVFLAEILDIEHVLCLDTDLIFLCDISNIYDSSITLSPISAPLRGKSHSEDYLLSINTDADKYFRIGVAFMNLKFMRNDANFTNGKWNFLEKKLPSINKIRSLPEQSVFNYYFSNTNIPLDCCLLPAGAFDIFGRNSAWDDGYGNFKNVIIDTKGWKNNSPLDLYYWAALLRTPWKDEAVKFFNKAAKRKTFTWRQLLGT